MANAFAPFRLLRRQQGGPKDSQEALLTNYDPPRMVPIECCQESAEAVPA